MTDQELFDDFIDFIKKQNRYGSSRFPLLEGTISQYTADAGETEILISRLNNLNAVRNIGNNTIIDLKKLPG